MTKLDKSLSRAVSWDRGDFIVTLFPSSIGVPMVGIRPKHGKKTLYATLPWLWAQMCKKEAEQ